jgi:competence protein ComEA
MTTITRFSTKLAALAVLLTLAVVATPAMAAETAAGTVNINTASAEELALLPGIGPSVAARIVIHRDANGNFRKPEELMLVKGVGEKTYANLEAWVAVEGKTTLTAKVRVPRKPRAEATPTAN